MALTELQKIKDDLAALDEEIAVERQRFDLSIAGLVERKIALGRDLADGLLAELASLEKDNASGNSRSDTTATRRRGGASKIDEEKIVAALRRHSPMGAQYIADQLSATVNGITSAQLSNKLRQMVDRGLLSKEGERRGTKYSVGPNA